MLENRQATKCFEVTRSTCLLIINRAIECGIHVCSIYAINRCALRLQPQAASYYSGRIPGLHMWCPGTDIQTTTPNLINPCHHATHMHVYTRSPLSVACSIFVQLQFVY